MTAPEFSPQAHEFLRAFFGAGNQLRWDGIEAKLQAGNPDQSLVPWLERLAKNPELVTLLPRVVEDATIWYGLGHSFSQSEQLKEELLAAVGPTYSDFVGQRAELDPNDPVEQAVLAFSGGHAFRMRVPVAKRDAARTALERLRRLWESRPPHVGVTVRSVGRILREFELALAVRDLAEARLRLDELRSCGMLDARNLLFQEIRLLAAGERWTEIMALDSLSDLAQVRCPVVVADAVLQAIYAVEFAAFETGDGPAAAVARFRDYALGRWSSFFRVKSTIRSPGALKLFMMLAVSATPARLELRDAVLAETALAGTDRAYCEAIASLAGASANEPPLEPLALSRARYEAGDYDAAFPAALAAPTSADQIRLLLNCAVELSRLDTTAAVLKVFEAAPLGVRDEVLASGRCRVLWQHLVGTSAPSGADLSPPASWLEWLERLNGAEEWPSALETAEQGAREWDPEAFLRDGAAVQRFRTLLTNGAGRSSAAQSTLRDSIPFLIEFLLRENDVLKRGRGVLEDLLLILTEEQEVGAADMGAIKEVIAALIDLGPPAQEYRELVSFLQDVWERFGAPRRIDWALEAFEILTLLPAPAPDARAGFGQRVLASFAKWRNQAAATHWQLLRVLCDTVGLAAAFAAIAPAEAEARSPRSMAETLEGKTVGIYSLMERTAQHARDVLQATCPGIEVVLNSDHVATASLRELARRADVFVMVWRAAKHPATECIEAARPKHLPLLRPDRPSATSILREIAAWCDDSAA